MGSSMFTTCSQRKQILTDKGRIDGNTIKVEDLNIIHQWKYHPDIKLI